MRNSKLLLTLLIAGSLLLAGCNDSGSSGSGTESNSDTTYGGNTSAATLNENNMSAFASGSSKAAARAIKGDSVQSIAPFSPLSLDSNGSPAPAEVLELLEAAWEWVRSQSDSVSDNTITARNTITDDEMCTGGGTVTYDTNDVPGQPDESGSMELTFNDCTFVDEDRTTVLNGTAILSWTANFETFTYVYDITYDIDGVKESWKGTFSCDGEGGCGYFDIYVDNGVTYQTENVTVGPSINETYDVSMRLYHGDYGYVTVVATALMLCDDGNSFASGSITITEESGGESITIQFNGCDSPMAVTYQGNSDLIEQ